MKKCIVILLLTCVALQSMHSLFTASIHFAQYQIRIQSNESLIQIQIPLQDFENGTVNCIEADEWQWHNEMYDIVSSFTKNGIIYATVFKDGIDKNLANQEKKQQEKKQSKSQSQTILFCQEIPITIFYKYKIITENNFIDFVEKLNQGVNSIIIPPPNSCYTVCNYTIV